MKLQKEFFEIYSSKNNYNKNVIDLDEENFSEDKEDKNYLKMQSVDDEIKYINYLIKITEQNLLTYENDNNVFNNNGNKFSLTFKDILELIIKANNNGNIGLINPKPEDKLNMEFDYLNGGKLTQNQKKLDFNQPKQLFNDEFQNLYDLSNNIYYTSNKNNKAINAENMDIKSVKVKDTDKEELINFKINREKENNNNIDLINNDNNENKSEIVNYNQIKNCYFDNKIRKDLIISDYSYCGNYNNNNNFFLDSNLFNNMNGFNYYNLCMNKSENEVF